MRTDSSKKATVKVALQDHQENVRNTRKTLKDLQQTADKENLIGRTPTFSKLEEKVSDTRKKKVAHKAIQTGDATITETDLTSDEPSADYWKVLAEKRGDALNKSLEENERLKQHVEALKEENKICKEMLEESKHLVAVLQEMLDEETTDAATATDE